MAKKLSPVMLDTLKLLDRQNGKLDTNHSEGERRVTRAYSREMKTIQALARRELIESIDFNYYPLTPAGRAALSEPATDAGEGLKPSSTEELFELMEDELTALRAERDALRAALEQARDVLGRLTEIDAIIMERGVVEQEEIGQMTFYTRHEGRDLGEDLKRIFLYVQPAFEVVKAALTR